MKNTLVPIVIVGGFLGAGKTSLMRNLIRDAKSRGLRIAVIVNEFGIEDVDSNILREGETELLASVAGGCACCSGQDDLQEVLRELSSRVAGNRPDAILLEASGLADTTLLLEVVTAPALLESVRVASIVGVIDCERATRMAVSPKGSREYSHSQRSELQSGALQKRQLLLCDFLLLNKTDLVAPELLASFTAALQKQHPRAHIVPCVRATIDSTPLWNRVREASTRDRQIGDTSREKAENAAPRNDEKIASTRADAQSYGESQDEVASTRDVCEVESAPRHAVFQTLVVSLPHPLPRADLEKLLRDLPGEEREDGVWRAKGFARLRGESGVWLVQFTGGLGGGRFAIAPFHRRMGDEEPKTALVFIGPALDAQALKHNCDALSLSGAY